jgi:hypothetical protein
LGLAPYRVHGCGHTLLSYCHKNRESTLNAVSRHAYEEYAMLDRPEVI